MNNMLDNETRRFFIRETASLAPVLYPVLDDALAETTKRLKKYDARDEPLLHAHHRRAAFRRRAKVEGVLPAGWMVGGNSRLGGQMLFTNQAERASLRVLSESKTNANGIPHAGHNLARQEAWLGREVFSDGELISDRNLLLLMDTTLEMPSLRVVHTTSRGKYKGRVECDFRVPFLRDAAEYQHASFDGADEEEDLFAAFIEDEGLSDV